MDKKEQWVNEVFNSLNSLQKATPNTELFSKISAQLPKGKVIKFVPLHKLAWIASAASVVIALNIYMYNKKYETIKSTPSNTKLICNYSLYAEN
jgi:hypothetical protein